MIRRILYSLLDLLFVDTAPWQLAGAVVAGFWVGVTPPTTLHWAILFIGLFFVRVHLPIAIASAIFFNLISELGDPIYHWIGNLLLVEIPPFFSIWSRLYHLPVVPFTRFNHTIVMGSFVVCALLSIPLFGGSRIFFKTRGRLWWSLFKESDPGQSLREMSLYRSYVRKRQA